MPKFRVEMMRTVEDYLSWSVEVEARDEDDAAAQALVLADNGDFEFVDGNVQSTTIDEIHRIADEAA